MLQAEVRGPARLLPAHNNRQKGVQVTPYTHKVKQSSADRQKCKGAVAQDFLPLLFRDSNPTGSFCRIDSYHVYVKDSYYVYVKVFFDSVFNISETFASVFVTAVLKYVLFK